ncbi:GNAT family N-acetyltransferase [Streptomyces paludis]|uniref:N-acetyltransferase n=1 Tax=Streptomyces paludis TaxID=2282738 RepID=A0A345HXJ1_9ACTN|nr:GNAT family N-acetyltransferase [Streptomyces paludis]AXG81415.1 N-acetyltransferase [Streptomyces paludis]
MRREVAGLSAEELLAAADALGELLTDAVAGGASVGFLDPLDRATAAQWWRDRVPAVREGRLSVRVAREAPPEGGSAGDAGGGPGRIVGCVMVTYADKANGRHRAEIGKLLVHRDARGRGTGRALLAAAEEAAARSGVTLLLLDTETGSPAETLYRSAGWTAVGVVPGHAADPGGTLRATTFFYKDVGATARPGTTVSVSGTEVRGAPASP